jgi:hypothetical protein
MTIDCTKRRDTDERKAGRKDILNISKGNSSRKREVV